MALHEHAYAEGRVGDSYRMAEISDSIRLEDLLEVGSRGCSSRNM